LVNNVLDEVQHVILYGPSGVGKGTFSKIFLAQTTFVDLPINGSIETGIDTVRKKIKDFAESASHKNWFGPEESENNKYVEKFGHSIQTHAPCSRKNDHAEKWYANQANRHIRSVLSFGANDCIVIEGLQGLYEIGVDFLNALGAGFRDFSIRLVGVMRTA